MLSKLKNEIGGAMLVALLLVPVISAGSLAVYMMAKTSTNTTMLAALEENGIFASASIADVFAGAVMNNAATRNQLWNMDENTFVPGYNPATLITGGESRYRNITTLYTVRKLLATEIAKGAEANTIAVEIITRTYNQATPEWRNSSYVVEHRIYQEFNMGIVKVVGCAADYDIFAGNDYEQKSLIDFSFFQNIAYYAGNQWRSCGAKAPFAGWLGKSCVDTPTNNVGVLESTKTNCGCKWLGLKTCSKCRSFSIASFFPVVRVVNCGTPYDITFENALYGSADVDADGQPDRNQVSGMNIDGSKGNNLYSSADPYPFTSMEKTVIDQISHDARPDATHADALASMQKDPNVGQITDATGTWYFRDVNDNKLPDFDTPYYYFEGNLVNLLPFSIDMMRFRNVYVYVNGNIKNFQLMGSGSGINSGNLYITALKNVNSFSMMKMAMLDAGLVVMAGRDITNSTMMKGSGINATTMIANHDINLAAGFQMTMGTRMRFVAGNDVIANSAMVGSIFTFGSNSSSCGCTDDSTGDVTTEMQLGRRLRQS